MQKLFTHEDNFNLHKIFGLYCLLNYFFQTGLFLTNGYVYLNVFTLLPHLFLHISSFVFKVLSKRPIQSKSSMFIWNELRLHALIFGFRSVLSILLPEFRIIWLFLTLISADVATHFYGTEGISTVRGNLENHGKRGIKKELLAAFFSTSQIGATLVVSGLFQNEFHPILNFLTLPAIQTSAFGMTLLRKNLITKETWSIVYSLELVLVYIFWYYIYGNVNVFLYSLPFYILRRQNISKYIIWSLYLLCHLWLM